VKHIFLSYAHTDQWEMRAIYNELRLSGLRVWIDDYLTPGTENWQRSIVESMNNSLCLICVCSPAAQRSKWVNIEIELANQRMLVVYPLLVKGEPDKSVPISLTNVQRCDSRRGFPSCIDALIKELTVRHREALVTDVRAIFDPNSIQWTRFGSLFWFASEIRKMRLFLAPENPTNKRIKESIAQLAHHATRVQVDKYTFREIETVAETLAKSDFRSLPAHRRRILADKLRSAQDRMARLAESLESAFQDGPFPSRPSR
jgi:hypothetical protein